MLVRITVTTNGSSEQFRLRLDTGPNHSGPYWIPAYIVLTRTGSSSESFDSDWILPRIILKRTGCLPESFQLELDPGPNYFNLEWILARTVWPWLESFRLRQHAGQKEFRFGLDHGPRHFDSTVSWSESFRLKLHPGLNHFDSSSFSK